MNDDLAEWTLAQIEEDELEAARLAKLIADGYFDDREDEFRRDPAKELVECDAKRQLHRIIWAELGDDREDVTAQQQMRLLALPFAGRDGYRMEWRPGDGW